MKDFTCRVDVDEDLEQGQAEEKLGQGQDGEAAGRGREAGRLVQQIPIARGLGAE